MPAVTVADTLCRTVKIFFGMVRGSTYLTNSFRRTSNFWHLYHTHSLKIFIPVAYGQTGAPFPELYTFSTQTISRVPKNKNTPFSFLARYNTQLGGNKRCILCPPIDRETDSDSLLVTNSFCLHSVYFCPYQMWPLDLVILK
jgi:hypothetical protein